MDKYIGFDISEGKVRRVRKVREREKSEDRKQETGERREKFSTLLILCLPSAASTNL